MVRIVVKVMVEVGSVLRFGLGLETVLGLGLGLWPVLCIGLGLRLWLGLG